MDFLQNLTSNVQPTFGTNYNWLTTEAVVKPVELTSTGALLFKTTELPEKFDAMLKNDFKGSRFVSPKDKEAFIQENGIVKFINSINRFKYLAQDDEALISSYVKLLQNSFTLNTKVNQSQFDTEYANIASRFNIDDNPFQLFVVDGALRATVDLDDWSMLPKYLKCFNYALEACGIQGNLVGNGTMEKFIKLFDETASYEFEKGTLHFIGVNPKYLNSRKTFFTNVLKTGNEYVFTPRENNSYNIAIQS